MLGIEEQLLVPLFELGDSMLIFFLRPCFQSLLPLLMYLLLFLQSVAQLGVPFFSHVLLVHIQFMPDELDLPLPLLPQKLFVQYLLTLPHLLLHCLHSSILQPKHMRSLFFPCFLELQNFEHIEWIYQHLLFIGKAWELVEMGEPIVKHAL